MESLNKFKVLTVILLCMFLFVIAAIYTNTKDVSTGKVKMKNEAANEQLQQNIKSDIAGVSENSGMVEDLSGQINLLNQRVDELSEKVNNSESAMKCQIYGSMTDNGIEQLTPEAAIQEAKVNNRELVVTCSF